MRRPRRITGLVALVVVAVCAGFGAHQDGIAGAVSALVGGAVVIVFLGSTAAVLGPMVKVLPHASMATSMLFYLTKIAALLALFVVLQDFTRPAGPLDRGILSGTVIVATIVWLVTRTIDDTRARVPTFDLPDDSDSAPDTLEGQ
ncbi:hypothetical protein D9V41_03355 [Aeromicrobium phragmitis]|uniref:ATP synthase protein I n=1 Tax=Aeromicrobium phragmitis TaxID=2478914 RepID=A0A3L8PS76_9ACTN|nr:hypothetical protein [Aeromicrobium phragmitis]RLV56822.1 hypothetical protein D9V41_03355 [Aeromicrobium phragmitis]